MANGLYYPDGSFKSDAEIRRQAVLKGEAPVFETRRKDIEQGLQYWTGRVTERQTAYHETVESDNLVKVALPKTSLITFQADQHIGGAYTDYDRIYKEAEIIANTNDSYVILGGDIVDAFFFNPAQYEDIEQTPEQIEYARALVKFYADKDKLLGAIVGNHSMWIKKAGFDPYRYIMQGVEAPYLHGISYFQVGVGAEEYKITGNHMFKGSSIYNNSHPQRRAMNESARGSDVVFSGHWHTKGISQQAFQEFGGKSQVTTMIALGTYKATDEYIKTYGFSNRDPNSMYGVTVKLDAERHLVTPYYDTIEAHRQFVQEP
jgi:predicted phosphodiesterase